MRALARRPERADDLRAAGCEVRQADALEPETLAPALEGADVAYYLVHSMGRGSDGDFAARDHTAAENFAAAAAAAGVERIVYLGGLGEGSKHLDSRHATAETLRRGEVPVSYFRAAAVIGAGSESFRTVFYLVRRARGEGLLQAVVSPDEQELDLRTRGFRTDVPMLAARSQRTRSREKRCSFSGITCRSRRRRSTLRNSAA